MKRNALNTYTSAILLGVLIVVLYNAFFNLHIHTDSSNRTYFHSHPFENADNASSASQHSHTDAELLLFLSLTTFQFIIIALLFKNNTLDCFSNLFININQRFKFQSLLNEVSPRAPPITA